MNGGYRVGLNNLYLYRNVVIEVCFQLSWEVVVKMHISVSALTGRVFIQQMAN